MGSYGATGPTPTFPAVFEIIEGKFELVFPKSMASAVPILPLPASSPLAVR